MRSCAIRALAACGKRKHTSGGGRHGAAHPRQAGGVDAPAPWQLIPQQHSLPGWQPRASASAHPGERSPLPACAAPLVRAGGWTALRVVRECRASECLDMVWSHFRIWLDPRPAVLAPVHATRPLLATPIARHGVGKCRRSCPEEGAPALGQAWPEGVRRLHKCGCQWAREDIGWQRRGSHSP